LLMCQAERLHRCPGFTSIREGYCNILAG